MGELIGKELGMEVARRVMGWTEQREIDFYDYDGPFPAFTDWETDKLLVHNQVIGEHGQSTTCRAWAAWRDMNDAWEVDKGTWLWRFIEHQMGIDVLLDDVDIGTRVSMTVEWGDFPTKSIMYCHLRLKAALQAKGGEG